MVMKMRELADKRAQGGKHQRSADSRVAHVEVAKNTLKHPRRSVLRRRREFTLLSIILEELREVRSSLREVKTCLDHMQGGPLARAVPSQAAQTLLGCGRTRIYELLRSGAIRRAPKVGRQVMIDLTSLEAFLDTLNCNSPLKIKRSSSGLRGAREAEKILELIRKPKMTGRTAPKEDLGS